MDEGSGFIEHGELKLLIKESHTFSILMIRIGKDRCKGLCLK
jgi:hypothetical protein